MKRTILTMLAFVLVIGISTTAFAASDTATQSADALHSLGLFDGVGTDANGSPNYDLDRAPTRAEAVTMLVRLLGKAEEAKAKTWTTPFTDVADWAKPYVGYAYANKLTMGTGATTFGSNDKVSTTQYLTFILRALGYESGSDFQWDKAWELTDKIGITSGEYNAKTTSFLRGDVVIISNQALAAAQKGNTKTLADKLIAEGIFTKAQFDNRNSASTAQTNPQSTTTPFTLTAFGDKWLHEYLMSLSPDESEYWKDNYFDDYSFADRYISDEICKKLQSSYTFVEVTEKTVSTKAKFNGTRVTTVESTKYGRNIQVEIFRDGAYSEKIFRLRAKGTSPNTANTVISETYNFPLDIQFSVNGEILPPFSAIRSSGGTYKIAVLINGEASSEYTLGSATNSACTVQKNNDGTFSATFDGSKDCTVSLTYGTKNVKSSVSFVCEKSVDGLSLQWHGQTIMPNKGFGHNLMSVFVAEVYYNGAKVSNYTVTASNGAPFTASVQSDGSLLLQKLQNGNGSVTIKYGSKSATFNVSMGG